MANALPFGQWRLEVGKAAATLPMEAVTKLQRQLVLLAMGAAVLLPGGGLARIIGVVARTPIGEINGGRARSSWQVTVGQPGAAVPPEGAQAAGPETAMNALASLQPGQTVWISSALPYITVLEFGGYPNPPKGGEGKTVNGFSRQAPQGMVRITLDELQSILNGALA